MADQSDDQRADSQAEALMKPLARLLRPLVRLLIHRGVTFPALGDMLRALYVDVAEHDFALSGKSQTDSRVSLLTGIHRKEVRRLRGAGTPVAEAPASLSLSSQIIAHWLAEAAYLDSDGLPLALPRQADPASTVSFERLVESVTKDVRPRAVLDEWLNRGIAHLDADGLVRLTTTAYVPPPGDADSLFYFGRNLGDHIAAAGANVAGPAARFFDRSLHYDGLGPVSIAKLDKLGRDGAMKLLLQLNRAAQTLANGETADTAKGRFNLGIYIYHSDGEDGRDD